MVDQRPEHDNQVDSRTSKAQETSKNAESEDASTADTTRDSKAATAKPFTDYHQVIHDRFQKAQKTQSSSFKAALEDSVSGATSMLQSMFGWSAKQPITESDNDRANGIIDELDAHFTPTLQTRMAAADDQDLRKLGQRAWSFMKPR